MIQNTMIPPFGVLYVVDDFRLLRHLKCILNTAFRRVIAKEQAKGGFTKVFLLCDYTLNFTLLSCVFSEPFSPPSY